MENTIKNLYEKINNTLNNDYIVRKHIIEFINTIYEYNLSKNNIDFENKWNKQKTTEKQTKFHILDKNGISDNGKIEQDDNDDFGKEKEKLNNIDDIKQLSNKNFDIYKLKLLLDKLNIEKLFKVCTQNDLNYLKLIRKISVHITIWIYSQNRFINMMNTEFNTLAQLIEQQQCDIDKFMNSNGLKYFIQYMLCFVECDDGYIMFMSGYMDALKKSNNAGFIYLKNNKEFIKGIVMHSQVEYVRGYFHKLMCMLDSLNKL
jgi:hypothetical protein